MVFFQLLVLPVLAAAVEVLLKQGQDRASLEEAYFPVEGGNGELGFYLVSDGSGKPLKCRVRPPCMNYVQAMEEMTVGHYMADIVPIFGSVNMIGGELDR